MKKIKKLRLIISSYDDKKNPYYGGGGAISIHEVAKRLTKDYSIVVLTGKYPGSKNEIIDNVSYERLGYAFLGPRFAQLIFQLFLPFYALKKNYDLWIESFTPPFSTAFLPMFTKKPVIGLVHLLGGKAKSRQYKLPFYLIERKGIKTYKAFIVLTHETLKVISSINPHAKIEIIPNGVNIIKGGQILRKKAKHLLFLGRIEIEQKGLDILLSAYKRIAHKIPYKLIIAGSGRRKDEKSISKLIAKLGLSKKVIFVGRIDGRKKDTLLRDALCLLLPSRFETFPLSILEAFVLKTTAVAFDIEDLKWIPENSSLKIKPFDEAAYAKAIEKISKDNNLRDLLGKNCYKFAKKFNWDDIAKKYNIFINNIYVKSIKNNQTKQ